MYHRTIACGVESMTKKDYELIARALRKVIENYEGADWTPLGVTSLTAHHIANELEKENPKFQRPLFLTTCGLKTEEVNA
jgi:hypothetical protein